MMQAIQPHIWWLAAIVCSLFSAGYYTANQYLGQNAATMIFWRALFVGMAFAPALFFIEWPTNPVFYILPLLTCALCFIADSKNMNGSARFGGGMTTRLKPFTLWLLFIAWLVFDSEHRAALMTEPIKFIAI